MRCTNCGTENNPETGFCATCGAPVKSPSMSGATYTLILAGVICLIAGFLYTNQMTMGIGGMVGACFFAILARIAQASKK